MKTKRLYFIYCISSFIFALTTTSALAQYHINEFGKNYYEYLNKDTYPADKDAEAVIVHDKGIAYFDLHVDESNYNIVFERYTQIKIFKESGTNYAEIEIPYYVDGRKFEHIRDIKGTTYNIENGEVVETPLDIKQVYEEKGNGNWKYKKFALPNVKKGSVIEYTYSLVTPFLTHLPDWNFQHYIPVVKSEYVVRMIPFYEYQFSLKGTKVLTRFDKTVSTSQRYFNGHKFNDVIYEFALENIPAFIEEPFITTPADYIISIDFQLNKIHHTNGATINFITNWESLNNELLEHNYFGKFIKDANRLAKQVLNEKQLVKKHTDETIKNIINYLKDTYKWNGRDGKFAQAKLNDFNKQKIGNSADINLMLVGFLQQAGINASPVILSTRQHGKVNYDAPFHHFFNYVLAAVEIEDTVKLFDATTWYCPYNVIPIKCINDKGLLVEKKKPDFVALQTKNISSEVKKTMNLWVSNSNDSLYGQFKFSHSGYDGMKARQQFGNDTKKINSEIVGRGIYTNNNVNITNLTNVRQAYTINFEGALPIEIIEGELFIKPFANEPPQMSPFKQNKRTYPVDMVYPRRHTFKTTLEIPQGYKVSYQPENLDYENELIKMGYHIAQQNNSLIITASYHFKKSTYPVIDYGKVKYYYYEIVNRFNDKIVLTPK